VRSTGPHRPRPILAVRPRRDVPLPRTPESRTADPAASLGELRPQVLRYCASRLADVETAQDVTQEVLLAVHVASVRDPSLDVLPYAFGVASNKVADVYRKQSRRPEHLTSEVPELADPYDGPESTALRRDEVRQVRRLLDRLSPRARELLLLRTAGLTAEQAGQVVGMSPGAVRVAQHRALTQLREAYAQSDDRPPGEQP
jgi:RNA polymerase sigma-70 factor (ECF subfamily)